MDILNIREYKQIYHSVFHALDAARVGSGATVVIVERRHWRRRSGCLCRRRVTQEATWRIFALVAQLARPDDADDAFVNIGTVPLGSHQPCVIVSDEFDVVFVPRVATACKRTGRVCTVGVCPAIVLTVCTFIIVQTRVNAIVHIPIVPVRTCTLVAAHRVFARDQSGGVILAVVRSAALVNVGTCKSAVRRVRNRWLA